MKFLFILLNILLLSGNIKSQKVDSKINKTTPDTVRKNVDSFSITHPKQTPLIIRPSVMKDKNLIITFKDSSNNFKDILPFITLLLGALIGLIVEWIKSFFRIKKNGHRWKAELKFLKKPITTQVKSIEAFINNYQATVFDLPVLQHVQHLDCKTFRPLNHEDFVAYIKRNYSKDYNEAIGNYIEINAFINILAKHSKSFENKYQEFLDGYQKYHERFNENVQKLTAAYRDYAVRMEHTLTPNEYANSLELQTLDRLFTDNIFQPMRRQELNYISLKENFFLPLIRFLGVQRLNHEFSEINLIVNDCMNNIAGINMERKYLIQNFTTLIEWFNDDITQLKKILTLLKIKMD